MKKILLTTIMAVALSTPALTCEDGKPVDRFCISNVSLNWWSAALWCKAQGMTLATIYDVCPDWDGNTGTNKCGKTYDYSGSCWTSTASGTERAFFITPSSGYIDINGSYGTRTDRCHALCI